MFCISSRISPRTLEIYVPTGRSGSGDGRGLKKIRFFLQGGVRGGRTVSTIWAHVTSSGPLKCEYFACIYIKVYGGSRCERFEEREGVGVGVRGVTSRM